MTKRKDERVFRSMAQFEHTFFPKREGSKKAVDPQEFGNTLASKMVERLKKAMRD